jgi:hypothetical protein
MTSSDLAARAFAAFQHEVLAETGSDLVTVSIWTWDRDDVRGVVEGVVRSLEIAVS